MNFLPTKKQDDWIKSKVESGDYANASEVLRELIRKEMEYENKLQELRGLIAEGMIGTSKPIDIEEIIREAEEENRLEKNGKI